MDGRINTLPARCPIAAAARPLRACVAGFHANPPVDGEASRVGVLSLIAPDEFWRIYCADAAPTPNSAPRMRPWERRRLFQFRAREAQT